MARLQNAQIIKAIVAKETPRLLKKEFFDRVVPRFKDVKQQMIKDFLEHPITQEILGGPSASNISGTLDGVTNLFAFIGFDKDDPLDPIQNILEVLERMTIRDVGPTRGGRTYKIDMPAPEDIWKVTPVPWVTGTRSWAQGMETGLSGIGFFAFAEVELNDSRSGVGFQRKKRVRKGVRFKNKKYISALLKEYEKRFRALGGRIQI